MFPAGALQTHRRATQGISVVVGTEDPLAYVGLSTNHSHPPQGLKNMQELLLHLLSVQLLLFSLTRTLILDLLHSNYLHSPEGTCKSRF